MYTFIIVIHVIACILLVCTVLLQKGKGAEIGAVFGSSEAIFGSAGPTSFLSKVTTSVAVIFMLTSLGLTYLSGHQTKGSVMEDVEVSSPAAQVEPSSEPAPAQEGAAPTQSGETSQPTKAAPSQPVATGAASQATEAAKSAQGQE